MKWGFHGAVLCGETSTWRASGVRFAPISGTTVTTAGKEAEKRSGFGSSRAAGGGRRGVLRPSVGPSMARVRAADHPWSALRTPRRPPPASGVSSLRSRRQASPSACGWRRGTVRSGRRSAARRRPCGQAHMDVRVGESAMDGRPSRDAWPASGRAPSGAALLLSLLSSPPKARPFWQVRGIAASAASHACCSDRTGQIGRDRRVRRQTSLASSRCPDARRCPSR